jgi:4-hydroxy-3-methylbut-2-en-1-yl diphosphate reductase
MREIVCAEHMGFCFGVQRALGIVHDLGAPLTVLGDLIHNPQEIDRLKHEGICFVKEIDEIIDATVVLSAHGTSERRKCQLSARGKKIVDATCPHVETIHRIVRELASHATLIIYGDRNHPEVKAVLSNARKAFCTRRPEDLGAFVANGPLAVVAQTTQHSELYQEFCDILLRRYPAATIHHTICRATQDRQLSAKTVARRVDLMIVVGGRNSANTKRLAQICGEIVTTKHIETAEELASDWFTHAHSIGITAGASTPDWIIQKVIEKMRTI